MTSKLEFKRNTKILRLGSTSEPSASVVERYSVGKLIIKHVELQVDQTLVSEEADVRPDVWFVDSLGSELKSQLSQCILIEGFIGTGKSTVVNFVIDNYCLEVYKIVLHIHSTSKIFERIRTLSDIAKELSLPLAQVRNDLEDAGGNLLIIFDEISDLIRQDDWTNTEFGKIICGSTYPNAVKLLVSRPSGVAPLLKSSKVNSRYRVIGFSDGDPDTDFTTQNSIKTLCEQHPSLVSISKIPLIAKLIRNFCERNQKQNDFTITDICLNVVTEIIKRRLKNTSYQFEENISLFSLPEDIFDEFVKLCQFGFESLASGHLLENSEQKQRFLSGFNLNHSFSLTSNETFGFVELSSSDSCSFQFVHPLIHEFLAGYYVQLIPPLDVLDVLHKHAFEMLSQDDPSIHWLIFFFGLTWRRNLTFDPTKYMISTLLEFLIHCLVSLRDETCKNAVLTVMLCVAETKEKVLWRKFASNLGGNISLQILGKVFEKHMWTIADMISSSEINDWSMSARDFNIPRELKNFELYTSVRMSKVVVHSLGESILLSPKISIEAASRRQKDFETFKESIDREAAFVNRYQCRAIREILQRVLKIFAEIGLKGDASNPAYVSFLSCECFKNKLEDNVVFDPSLPYHFLEVTSEKTLKKIQGEHRTHLAVHGGKAMELVILLKPFVRRVTVTIPHTSEKHCIVFMSEELAHTVIGEGAISSSLASSDSTQVMLDTSINETASTSSSEMVRPCLPLPQKLEQSLRATAVLPHVEIPGAVHVPLLLPNVHEDVEDEGTRMRQQVPDYDSSRSGEGGIGNNGTSHYGVPFTLAIASQQTTATVTSSQQPLSTKSSIREGTVLFTSVPNQIPADLIHPLPDETHQMRRGGNGQIFRSTIGGMNVVYKKTNYRSKEYAIVTKIKHKNIVRLLAFMYGAENPAHKRRHFCYHIMPQLSGDCARMLTDKEQLTIKELNKKHESNIRKMGVIRGNLKYLLKEVLHGLRYLHSLRIAHRDIKGSNILLNFFCACTNPLECGCDTKYQVQICDFDAGIELGENERLPPTQIGSRQSSRTHYICVPVGTDGFRSPECSMLASSNSADAFSPPITTRCDIWSLGILTTRILIGAPGPSKQRQMALLLLHYHRQRYMHEGLHKPGYLEVDRLVTDQLLNVSLYLE